MAHGGRGCTPSPVETVLVVVVVVVVVVVGFVDTLVRGDG